MKKDDASFGFRNFGNSWKRTATGTAANRTLHGKFGRGRYTAFAIGNIATWTTVHRDDPEATLGHALEVRGNRAALKRFEISEPTQTAEPSGTTVRVFQLTERAEKDLEKENIFSDLTARFAPYLEKYTDVEIWFRNKRVDPKTLQARVNRYPIPIPGESGVAELVVIEWTQQVDRQLYLCDENGSALTELAPGVKVGPYHFTAYLRWEGFKELGHSLLLPDLGGGDAWELLELARAQLRAHFRERERDREKEILAEWDAEGSYPYKEPAATPTEVVERQAFDVVALAAAPVVNDAPPRSRALTLNLIRTALETSPAALQHVLENVLELPADRVLELRRLLDKTTLACIIGSSKIIAGRLDFLSGLDALLFDKEPRKQTLERRQLHRILANETWIFGEEWSLTGDDDRLTQVLKKHLEMLGNDVELADLTPVVRNGYPQDGIPDLVLSRSRTTAENRYEYLVVELKRPSHTLTTTDVNQIGSYAGAVSRDERFQQPNVNWNFWLVGNCTTPDVDDMREQQDRPYGIAIPSKRYTVWVKTWAEVIGDANHRHKFVKESLDYTTDRDQGVQYLREKHAQYLPLSLVTPPTVVDVDALADRAEQTAD
jgi:hypothetical protein